MTRLPLALATWFGCGYFPWGPGTIGSLAAVLLVVLLHSRSSFGRIQLLLLTGFLFLPGVWAATQTSRLVKRDDPGLIVVDEVLGQWVTIAGATVWNVKSFAAAFVLFRLFDIWKPWPVRKLESLPEGWGIVADDLAAGVYGAIILYISGSARLY